MDVESKGSVIFYAVQRKVSSMEWPGYTGCFCLWGIRLNEEPMNSYSTCVLAKIKKGV